MTKFYMIAHTHWDREWYKSYQENRVRLIGFMDDLFETLENDERFTCFMLDGQTSIILDYLEIKPFNKMRLMDLIKRHRIIVGPWFVQPDENLPSGESIIRNLLISKSISDEFGDYMKVGYLPDSFGQSAAMPTILKGFGIDSACFYRGLESDDTPYNEFLWQGADGSEIIAAWLPVGYGNGMFLSEDLEKSICEIEKNIKLLKERSISSNIILMCGSDQCFIKKFTPQICERLKEYYLLQGKDYEFAITSLENYMNDLNRFRDKMVVIKGELRKGRHSRAHISIGGTRLDIKKKNFEVEQTYQDLLEPIVALVSLYDGITDSEIINRGWRYIIENHAHDSICSCCSDIIHKEILMRIEYANQIANTIIKDKFSKLHSLIRYDSEKGRPVIIFSSFGGKRNELANVDVYVKDMNFSLYDAYGNEIDYTIKSCQDFNLKDTKVSLSTIPDDFYKKVNIEFYAYIDGLGYTTYYVKEGRAKSKAKLQSGLVHDNCLENDYIKAEIQENCSIKITDKITGNIYDNANVFYESGNAGDEYDYSPPYKDKVITSYMCLRDVKILENTTLKGAFLLNYSLNVPRSTDASSRSTQYVPLDIAVTMTIYRFGRRIDFETVINNTAQNHRIQVGFDFPCKTRTHFADVQFGEIERENESSKTVESENENWSERYYGVYDQHKFCGIRAGQYGFVIINRGLPQYEVENADKTKLKITLLSGVGFMGHENLKYRKGRRSGAVCATPDAQMIGKFTTQYSFLPICEGFDYHAEAERYVNPVRAVSYPEYDCDGIWPDNLALVKCENGLQISAFKCAQDKKGYILRIVNPTSDDKKDSAIVLNRYIFKKVESVNLAEEKQDDKDVVPIDANNADGSDKAEFSGTFVIKNIKRNGLKSQRIYKDK